MTRRRRGREIISGRRGKCRPGNARRDDVDPNAVPLCRMRSRPMMHLAITIDRAGSKSYYHETNDRSGNDQIPEAAISRERVRNAFRFTRTHSQHCMYVRVCTTSSRAHIPRIYSALFTYRSRTRQIRDPRPFLAFSLLRGWARAQVLQIIVLISCNGGTSPRVFYHQHERRHDTSSIEFTELLVVKNQMDGFPDFTLTTF